MASRSGKGGVVVDVNWDHVERRLLRQANRAQAALDMQVLKDCDPYLPFDEGNLQKSGIRATKPGLGRVIWDAIYAFRQYWSLPKKSHDVHPQAVVRWFEAAKAVKGRSWIALAKRIGGGT